MDVQELSEDSKKVLIAILANLSRKNISEILGIEAKAERVFMVDQELYSQLTWRLEEDLKIDIVDIPINIDFEVTCV